MTLDNEDYRVAVKNEDEIATYTIRHMLDLATVEKIAGMKYGENIHPAFAAHCRAVYLQRAKELKIEKQVKDMIRAYDEAERTLSIAYTNEAKSGNLSLVYDGHGKPLVSIDNFLTILRADDYFSGLKFNVMKHAPEHLSPENTITQWLDKDDAKARHYIEHKYKLHNAAKYSDAIRILFSEREYHPLQERVQSLTWDGNSRIKRFLIYATKCEDTPYTREVSRLIFAGGINRLFDPGCKFDDMPVLIGTKQGEGKSTLVQWLALQDDYFDELKDFDSDRALETISGKWILEVGELLALTRTKDVEGVKSFISRRNDRRRLPYDVRTTDHYRQCIFIGTTNKEQFLTDKTGNRRFYPVKVNTSGYDLFDRATEIKLFINQCWAEAYALYNQKSPDIAPYMDRKYKHIVEEQQSLAVEDDYRVGLVTQYLSSRTSVCILELWQNALNNPPHIKPSRKDSNDLALILQSFPEWVNPQKTTRTTLYGVQKVWVNETKLQAEREIIE